MYLRTSPEVRKDGGKLLSVLQQVCAVFCKSKKSLKWVLSSLTDILGSLFAETYVDETMYSSKKALETLIPDYELACRFQSKVSLTLPSGSDSNSVIDIETKVRLLTLSTTRA